MALNLPYPKDAVLKYGSSTSFRQRKENFNSSQSIYSWRTNPISSSSELQSSDPFLQVRTVQITLHRYATHLRRPIWVTQQCTLIYLPSYNGKSTTQQNANFSRYRIKTRSWLIFTRNLPSPALTASEFPAAHKVISPLSHRDTRQLARNCRKLFRTDQRSIHLLQCNDLAKTRIKTAIVW